jgi:hypothetical protein
MSKHANPPRSPAAARLAARILAMPRDELAETYRQLTGKATGHTFPTLGYLRSRVLAATVALADRRA